MTEGGGPLAAGRRRHPLRGLLSRAADELGLASLWSCPRDVKLLCAQRFVRLFAYGGSTLVLVAFLQALGVSRARAGLFMTLTLVGDVAISFLLTLFADGLGRRAVLGLGAALMAGSGVVFALFGNYWVLLAAAVLGVISPSGNEIGPFRAIEESVVAHLTPSASRSDVYAWYSLSGTAGTAFGMVTCGWAIQALTSRAAWALADAYRAVFFAYAAFGVVKLALTLLLSSAVEADRKPPASSRPAGAAPAAQGTEQTPLLAGAAAAENGEREGEEPKRSRLRSLLPDISRESASVLFSLCVLFALDSFASGLAPLSWMTFFFRSQYGLEEGKLGSVFFVTSIIAAASMIVASSLAKRFGNVNTMVFTHLPSAIFLALIGVPNEVHLSLTFLVLRSCTQSMDVAPRSAFLAAVVLPGERTAVMGTINVVKTVGQSMGPLITGVLAERRLFWLAFVVAGSFKACYDLGMLALFKNHEREREERERIEAQRRGEVDAA